MSTEAAKSVHYAGSGAYCYANSLHMLIQSQGKEVNTATLESITLVGNSASWYNGLLFFTGTNWKPDKGISFALDTLEIPFEEHFCPEPTEKDWTESLHILEGWLQEGPVLVGPVDMGLLKYLPYHDQVLGVDHYVVVVDYDGEQVVLHDPEGFPYARLDVEALARAWFAENISYKRGAYSMWGNLRIDEDWTVPDSVFHTANAKLGELFAEERANTTLLSGAEAIRHLKTLSPLHDSPKLLNHLINFALPLGGRRAGDCALFYSASDPQRAEQKRQMAMLFGEFYSLLTSDGTTNDVVSCIDALAALEEQFQRCTLASVRSE